MPPEEAAMPPTPTAGIASLGAARKLALVAEILRAYVVVRWRMRGPDIRLTVARLRGDASGPGRSDRPLARHLGRAVTRTLGVLPTDNRCLARSLVLDTLLTRRSLQSVVVLAACAEPTFEAHAWVEHDGVPVLPAGSESFKRLVEL
jgi:hypothetical protein